MVEVVAQPKKKHAVLVAERHVSDVRFYRSAVGSGRREKPSAPDRVLVACAIAGVA